MKKSIITMLAIVAIIFAGIHCSQQLPTKPSVVVPITHCFCADTTQCNTLCSTLPTEPDLSNPVLFPTLGYQATLDSIRQPPFDEFSWQAFVALNWPAGNTGQPVPGKAIGSLPQNKRVWEYYPDSDAIFGDTSGCATCNMDCDDLFVRVSKGKFTVNPDGAFTESDGHVLIDKNLNFVVFDIKVNPTEAAYLDTLKSQYPNIDNIDFPLGSIELKTSWRILDEKQGDDLSRYYSRQATIYVPAANSESGEALCIPATIGLVGYHIAFKVSPDKHLDPWLWITFEQVDNVPASIEAAQMARQQPSRYSFYNPRCLNCPINTPPPGDNGKFKWAATPPYAAKYATTAPKSEGEGITTYGTQVVREFPIYYTTQLMNQEWQAKLKGSPFEFYQLVGTQWGTSPDNPVGGVTLFAPSLLSNTTQETYYQRKPIASCGGCHAFANLIIGTDTLNGDHSFLLGNLGN